jgi:Tfp pilus assembly protein PilF
MNSWARAQEFLSQGNIDAASSEVRSSLGLQPRDPRAYVVLARIEARRGNIVASRAAYTKALALTHEVDADFFKGVRAIVEQESAQVENAPTGI